MALDVKEARFRSVLGNDLGFLRGKYRPSFGDDGVLGGLTPLSQFLTIL